MRRSAMKRSRVETPEGRVAYSRNVPRADEASNQHFDVTQGTERRTLDTLTRARQWVLGSR